MWIYPKTVYLILIPRLDDVRWRNGNIYFLFFFTFSTVSHLFVHRYNKLFVFLCITKIDVRFVVASVRICVPSRPSPLYVLHLVGYSPLVASIIGPVDISANCLIFIFPWGFSIFLLLIISPDLLWSNHRSSYSCIFAIFVILCLFFQLMGFQTMTELSQHAIPAVDMINATSRLQLEAAEVSLPIFKPK